MHRLAPHMQGHLAMLLFSILIAGSFSLGVQIADMMAPQSINAIRFLIATCVICVIAHVRVGFKAEYFVAPWRYLLLGVVFIIYFVLMFEGLKTAEPVSASAVFTLTPLMSAGFGYLLLRQVTTLRTALALAVAATGALWVIFDADLMALLAFNVGRGESIYFIGCISHALYTPLVRKLNRGEPVLVFTFGTLFAGTICLFLVSWQDLLMIEWAALTPFFWGSLLYIAIFASATTFFLLQFSAVRLQSSKVMAYTYLTPTWVILWEVVQGRPVPTFWVFIGVGVTVIALLMLLKNEETQ